MALEYKLGNAILPNDERTRCYTDLFCRTSSAFRFTGNNDDIELCAGGKYDFATFIGSLSIGKWCEYTTIDNVHLRIDIEGRGEISIYGLEYQPEFHVAKRYLIDVVPFDETSDKALDFDLTKHTGYTSLAFGISCFDNCVLRDAYWYSLVDETKIRDVELSICITTFKKENYVLANVKQFEELMASDEPIAKHLQVHIVDNGQTLGDKISENPAIFIHPNKNAGGAGGFARGMIESLSAETKPTHVLVMDDDISVLKEAFVRTYSLLTMLSREYENAFISGAMMSMNVPNEQFEDVGHITAKGQYLTVKRHFNMFEINDVCENETMPPVFRHQYAAFWFCCIPIGEIERGGLPLPFFVRGDDAEFGLRVPGRKFMTMNGICVWHDSFGQSKFRAHMECYLSIRNTLIIQAVSPSYQGEPLDLFERLAVDTIEREFRKFAYNNVELALMAVEDYLKGPEFLMNMDCGEMLSRITKLNEKDEQLHDIIEGDMDDLWYEPSRSFIEKALMASSRNCQRLIPKRFTSDVPIVAPSDFHWSPVKRIFRHNTIIFVNEDRRTGIVRRKDAERFKRLYERYKKDRKAYNARRESIAEEWRNAYPTLKSLEFWRRYLGLPDPQDMGDK